MRKSTAVVASLVAFSALAISLRLGDLSNQANIPVDVTASPSSPATPAPTNSAPVGPTPSGSPAKPQPPKPVAKPVTKQSDVINYRYGSVQVAVTKLGNEITAVDLLQGDATNGRAQAYSTLIDATLQVQGTKYGNVSGATFTTDAFKSAVESALAKF